jgi:hypothetical protein
MTPPRRQLHLNAFLMTVGHHESAWRFPETDPLAAWDLKHYVQLARVAERGRFDSIFFGTDLPCRGTSASAPSGASIRPLCCRRSPPSRNASVWSRRHRPRTTSRTTSRGALPRSITSAEGAPAGASSLPLEVMPRRTSASTTCPSTGIVTNVRRRLSRSAGRSGIAGRTASSRGRVHRPADARRRASLLRGPEASGAGIPGATLREHYGLSCPANQFTARRQQALSAS